MKRHDECMAVLTSHFESLVTTSGIAEEALRNNPKLIGILEDVIRRVKAASQTEDGRVMDATDPNASPIRYLALKRLADFKNT